MSGWLPPGTTDKHIDDSAEESPEALQVDLLASIRRRTHRYHGYLITYQMKPIPDRSFDWNYAHKDYDGPGDLRCGNAESLSAAMSEIDELLAEGDRDE